MKSITEYKALFSAQNVDITNWDKFQNKMDEKGVHRFLTLAEEINKNGIFSHSNLISFETIDDLYLLDIRYRRLIMNVLQHFEVNLKAQINLYIHNLYNTKTKPSIEIMNEISTESIKQVQRDFAIADKQLDRVWDIMNCVKSYSKYNEKVKKNKKINGLWVESWIDQLEFGDLIMLVRTIQYQTKTNFLNYATGISTDDVIAMLDMIRTFRNNAAHHNTFPKKNDIKPVTIISGQNAGQQSIVNYNDFTAWMLKLWNPNDIPLLSYFENFSEKLNAIKLKNPLNFPLLFKLVVNINEQKFFNIR